MPRFYGMFVNKACCWTRHGSMYLIIKETNFCEFSQVLGLAKLDKTHSHCSYWDIYISQKIRLCEGDFESKFQTIVQASIMNFLIWKFRSITLIFLLFFARVVKSTAFCTQLLLFQKGSVVSVTFLQLKHVKSLE